MFALTMGERRLLHRSVGNEHAVSIGRHRSSAASLPGGGRLIKTHEPYNHRYSRSIHLVRDPRDVAISYWSFMQRIGKIVVRPKTTRRHRSITSSMPSLPAASTPSRRGQRTSIPT